MRETQINYTTNQKIAGLSHRLSRKSGLYIEQHTWNQKEENNGYFECWKKAIL